jgi:threonine/homoserine/homoserine lactone efflux protein
MHDIVNLPVFLLAVLGLCAMPGPDCLYIAGRTLAQGRRAGVVSAVGVICGAAVHVCFAALGLSAFLAASAGAFMAVKLLGAAYLVFLGVQTFLAKPARPDLPEEAPSVRERELFVQGLLTDVLNPKVALFFLAFLPQFIRPGATHTVGAFLALGGMVLAIGLSWDLGVVLAADRLAGLVRGRRRGFMAGRWPGRMLGGLFVGLGLALGCEEL